MFILFARAAVQLASTSSSRIKIKVFMVCTTVVLLSFLDGLCPCVFPSLVMRVGGVGCHPGAVLELGGVRE